MPETLLLGAHMSIAGGTPMAIERAVRAGCSVLQIFVKNNNRWKGKPLVEEEVRVFARAWKNSRLCSIVAHDCYLINLAAPDGSLRRLSIESLLDEVERCERLELSHLVMHPGSHVGQGEMAGVEAVSRAINEVLEKAAGYRVKLALETTAGQGTSVGYRFEQLRDIMSGCHEPERLAICLDTCHVFAAGYELRTREGYLATMERLERTVGMVKVEVLHFNDSKKDLGARVDRHEHIGKGKMGTAAFRWFLEDPRFAKVPKILETPKGKTLRLDRMNLAVLRSLAKVHGS
ncbi:MAG: deoxyribonuclease IV [Acidobacteria bacterium]|nr:deoxyribonuclease IV [Acidobacteriota bacterium]